MFLTIYILCRDRAAFAKDSIKSVLAQTCQQFNLIVSDHSTNTSVEEMIRENFPNITYVRRPSSLKHLEHFNLCIGEAKTNYYCLFHDDDILLPNYVEEMLQFIESYRGAVAFACNAYVENNGKIDKNFSFLSHKKVETINSPKQLAHRYFSRNQSGIAPNPSYIYNKKLISESKFIVDGGKYADVSLLLDIAQLGEIVWLNKPLMTYRIHGHNLGSTESLPDRLRFLAYLKKHQDTLGTVVLYDYRSSFIYKRILKNKPGIGVKRYRIAQSYLSFYRCYHYLQLSTYKALLVRLANKLARL